MAAARDLCCGRTTPGGGCYPYHRAWPFKRVIGSQGSVWWHGAAYLASFRALARTGGVQRILISGSADYSLLAHVWHAFQLEGARPEITVLDFCAAPLAINRWYAERVGAPVTTVAASIFDYAADRAFDLVTTDNFLSQFPPADRERIVRRWWHLVRPGGYTVGAQTVSNSPNVSRRSYSAEKIAARRDRILQQVQGRDPTGYLPPEALGPLLEAYYASHVRYPIRDAGELKRLLANHGFLVEREELLPPEAREGRTRPESDSKARDRIHFVARRANELPPFPAETGAKAPTHPHLTP
jgi:hypothetical protein